MYTTLAPAIPKITLKPDAAKFLLELPAALKAHLIDVIREKAKTPHLQMIVLSYTCDGSWPWIERAMKDYTVRPGIRILFHIVHSPDGICVDKIAWRDQFPYDR